jgi:hypothetical protein
VPIEVTDPAAMTNPPIQRKQKLPEQSSRVDRQQGFAYCFIGKASQSTGMYFP